MNRNYKILWTTFLISNFGDWLRKLALPLLVFEKTGSSFHMASLYGISFLPWITFSLAGGVLADKYKKTSIISFGHLISLLFLGLLIAAFNGEQLFLPLLYLLTFLLSSIEPLIHPAFQSLLPQIVEIKSLTRANSGLQLIDNTLNLIGPMISGIVLIFFPPLNSLWINALTFLVAGLLILRIDSRVNQMKDKKDSLSQTIKLGFGEVKENKVILCGSLLFFGTNFGIHLFQANLVYYITDVLGYSAFHYGVILSMGGVGSVLGSIISPKIISKFNYGKIISVCTIFAGVATICISLYSHYIYIGSLLGISTFFGNINAITYFTLRQKMIKQEILGRVISITRMISYASIPLGAYLGGILVNYGTSIFIIILIAGSIRFFVGILGFLSPLGQNSF